MPWSPPCDSDSDCEVLLGQGSTCGYDYFVPEGGCYPAFMGCPRPDSLCLDLPAANLGTLDYWYHSMPPLPTYVPGGETPAYAGTLVLEMSPDALGTFTIPLHDFPDTRINVLYGTLPIASVMPARIRVGAGCCLPDGSCITDDGSCRDEGGTPAHYPCQGDCDGNGVDDACEAADDCNNNNVVDTCDISGGTSEDTNSNWIPDECEEGACCLCATGPGCTHTSLLECNNMGGYFAAAGQYCAEVSCPTGMPPNDDAAGAITVTEGIFDFDNRCATTDGLWIEGEMCIWDPDVPLEKDVWFEYAPACDGWLSVGVTGAESDPLVAVYCNDYLGTCDSLPSPSREFACSQDGVVQLPVEADKCYLIRVGGDPGTAGTILVDMLCSVVDCMWYAAPEAEPGGADKNRYLSFSGGYPGRPQALRVTLVDMPPPFDYLDGDIMWVGPPNQLTEASGSSDDTPPAFWSAKLDCEPHLMDWSELGVIHVTGEAVVPGATYRIDALDAYCVPSTCYEHGCWPGCFWDPLIVHTGSWGDAVGDCAVTPCTGPDGLVDFVDIMAVVDKFRNLPTAPIKARADLCPDEPDGIIDFVDISWIVGAFRGHAYPYDGPAGCQ